MEVRNEHLHWFTQQMSCLWEKKICAWGMCPGQTLSFPHALFQVLQVDYDTPLSEIKKKFRRVSGQVCITFQWESDLIQVTDAVKKQFRARLQKLFVFASVVSGGRISFKKKKKKKKTTQKQPVTVWVERVFNANRGKTSKGCLSDLFRHPRAKSFGPSNTQGSTLAHFIGIDNLAVCDAKKSAGLFLFTTHPLESKAACREKKINVHA